MRGSRRPGVPARAVLARDGRGVSSALLRSSSNSSISSRGPILRPGDDGAPAIEAEPKLKELRVFVVYRSGVSRSRSCREDEEPGEEVVEEEPLDLGRSDIEGKLDK